MGSNIVSLPTGWKEILAYISIPSDTTHPVYTFNILKQFCTNTEQYFRNGYGFGNNNNYVNLNVTLTTAKIGVNYSGSIDRTSSSKLIVYYK